MSGGVAVNFDYLFKYIIIGDAAVGKSNLLLRYTHGQFKPEYQLTIGVEFGAKNITISNKTYRIQIWDTAGQENFRSITRAYYKNSACALVVYDITNRESFDNVSTWIEDCRNQSPQTIFMVLVGNKTDLELENKRAVSFEEGQELAKKKKNVDEIFYRSAESIAKRIEENFYDLENESCGIKPGIMKKKQEVNIDSGNFMDKSNNNNRKKDCC